MKDRVIHRCSRCGYRWYCGKGSECDITSQQQIDARHTSVAHRKYHLTWPEAEVKKEESMSNVQNLMDDLRETVEDLAKAINEDAAYKAKQSSASQPSVVQARIRGERTLHIQRGYLGSYKTADVSLTDAEADSFSNTYADGKSFAGSGKGYVIGKEYADGSIRFGSGGGLTVKNPFTNKY